MELPYVDIIGCSLQAAGRKKNCLVKQWTYQLQCAILKLD